MGSPAVNSRPADWYAKEAAMCFLLPIVAVAIVLWCGAALLIVIVHDLLWQRSIGADLYARVEHHSPLVQKYTAPKIIHLRFLA